MSEATITRLAAACFLLGLGLVLLVDLGIARIVGVPLAFVGIALGVRAIASPEFLEGDREP
ncbi:MAG TPA: hypothetical protein VHF58_11730 [Solirubrobacterales bacterium]|nr:hypothetical protein [Solirubrobacterales bacterium]